jgi:hypothetical protein
MFSGVSERSVATKTTSSTMPASSHDFAVIRPAFPEAHMADTVIAGPWKPYSCIRVDIGVDGISARYSWTESRPALLV